MGYEQNATPEELRELMKLARQMRDMAERAELETDRYLYANAAEVLEKRARWMAETTAEQRANELRTHQPVNMWV